MTSKRKPFSASLRTVTAAALLAAAFVPAAGTKAFAGKEGVFVSDTIYFSLDDVAISPSGNGQTVSFGVDLTNGSGSAFNMNGYGIQLYAADGSTYSARLTEQASGTVPSGKTSTYRYVADVPTGLTADQLKVDVFAWDFSRAPYMDEIGKLSIPQADVKLSGSGQVLLNMRDVDAALGTDTYVSFELLHSTKALVNGSWYMYAELAVENRSSSSLKLPASLGFELADASGNKYGSEAVSGADRELLPHGRSVVTVQLPVGDVANGGGTDDGYALEFLQQATGQTDETVLGSLPLGQSAGAGETADLPNIDGSKLQLKVERSFVSDGADSRQVTSIVTLKNEGSSAAKVPALGAGYQLKDSVVSAAATDSAAEAHPAYLGAGESATYSFTASLPVGTDASQVQLVVWDKTNAVLPVPVRVTDVSASAASSTGNSVYTSIGQLSFSRASTYRLPTDTGDDVLMTEVTVKNEDDHIVSLPAAAGLYGGYRFGSLSEDGKVAYLQSSTLLSPGQTATFYVYTKIPYDTPVDGGYVYFGSANTQTGSPQKAEWTELAFDAPSVALNPIETGQDFAAADSSRPASGRIVDSKVYDFGTQKLLAVRILQTNLSARGGTAKDYTGYAADPNGNVWQFKTTADTSTKLAVNGQSLTTLWSVLPGSANPADWTFIFGTELADGIIAKPLAYRFAVTPETGSVSGSSINLASLYPYSLSMTNGKLQLNSTGVYEVSFDYTQTKQGDADVAGASTDRSLQLVLQDNAGDTVKSWEYPLEGTLNGAGPLTSGATAKLSVPLSAISDLADLITGPKLAVYEKFEGGTRLVGTLNLSLY